MSNIEHEHKWQFAELHWPPYKAAQPVQIFICSLMCGARKNVKSNK